MTASYTFASFFVETHNIQLYHRHELLPFLVVLYLYMCYHFLYHHDLSNLPLALRMEIPTIITIFSRYNWSRKLLPVHKWKHLFEVPHDVSQFPTTKSSDDAIWFVDYHVPIIMISYITFRRRTLKSYQQRRE